MERRLFLCQPIAALNQLEEPAHEPRSRGTVDHVVVECHCQIEDLARLDVAVHHRGLLGDAAHDQAERMHWGVNPQPLHPWPNMPNAVMPTVPPCVTRRAGSRRMAARSRAINSLDSGLGSTSPYRTQDTIPLFGGTAWVWTVRISWWISRKLLWLARRMT